MKRQHVPDVNTPERYDDIYFGERTVQLMAIPYLIDLLQIICREGQVLDVGCGLGRYTPYFNNCHVTGLDFTEKVLAQAQADYPQAQFDKWDIAKDGLNLYKSNNFDYVFCGEVIEHMEKPQELINEILRVLKPNGIAIITTPYEDRIVCDEHIWEYNFSDLKTMFKEFNHTAISRYHNVYAADWEHFVVIAQKGKYSETGDSKDSQAAVVSPLPEASEQGV